MTNSTVNKRELLLRKNLKENFEFYAITALKIKPKSGSLESFTLNRAQKYLHNVTEEQLKNKGRVRIIVLKGRQQGISTYIEGRFYWKTTHRKGVGAFILTHEDKATTSLFDMAQRYHDNCLSQLKPSTGAQSAKELYFNALDSGYRVGTAGAKAVGRSTTNQYFHGSEVGFWPHADTHAMGVMQSIPLLDKTEIFLESTANGIGDYFHTQWQLAERGETEYIAVFLPWYWQEEYKIKCDDKFKLSQSESEFLDLFSADGLTAEHMNWRRMKINEFRSGGEDGGWKFKQEYPFTAAEAFQNSGEESLINPQTVLRARKTDRIISGAHVVGVDPARFGDDRTAIIHRSGRKMWGSQSYKKKSVTEVAGICARLLTDPTSGKRSDIDMMFIDVGGLGAGVYDILSEQGYYEDGRIRAVNSANRALQDDRYANKRAEMAVDMKLWFEMEGSVDIEDLDVLQVDFCGPRFSYDSSGRILIEKKEKMKKRGLQSPDFFDAAALTFAEPIASPNVKKRLARENIKTVEYYT